MNVLFDAVFSDIDVVECNQRKTIHSLHKPIAERIKKESLSNGDI